MHQEQSLSPSLSQVLQILNLTETTPIWQTGWAEAEQSYPQDELPFINPEFVKQQAQFLQLEPELTQALLDGLNLFQRQPAFKHLLWYCYHRFFEQAFLDPKVAENWPDFSHTIDKAAPLFYVYVYLAGIPHLLAYHQKHNIPLAITRYTLTDVDIWMKDYYDRYGYWGFDRQSWVCFHFAGRLYKLGRLQFELLKNYYTHQAFQHQKTGQVLVLAGAGLAVRQDGLLNGTDGVFDENTWETTLNHSAETASGYPINRQTGRIARNLTQLDLADWFLVLQRQDTALGVHIPASGPMDFEQCQASFKQAIPFFKQYFPEHPVNAFVCSSWLLDTQLADYLSPQSNIVRFLRHWYLLPDANGNSQEVLWRIYGLVPTDLSQVAQNTSLERAVVKHLQQGGHWWGGAGLIFPKEPK